MREDPGTRACLRRCTAQRLRPAVAGLLFDGLWGADERLTGVLMLWPTINHGADWDTVRQLALLLAVEVGDASTGIASVGWATGACAGSRWMAAVVRQHGGHAFKHPLPLRR